jgi:hypothetical protein
MEPNPPPPPPPEHPGEEGGSDRGTEQPSMLSPSVPALKTIEMGDGKHYSDPVLLGIEAGSGRTAEEDGAVWRLVWRFHPNFLRCTPPL